MVKLPSKIFIKQKVEKLEIFTGFETANKYSILDDKGKEILYAYETEGNMLLKQFMKQRRALDLHITDKTGKKVLDIHRPFFWFLTSGNIALPNGKSLGSVKQKWKIPGARFEFFSPNGNLYFECIMKVPSIWTYKVMKEGKQIAQINKKWSGFGREIFTDASKFMVDFMSVKDENLKQAILSMAFIVDLAVFER